MSFPNFSNLNALAADLEKNGKNPELRRRLNQAWRAQSCLGDLRQAEDCCKVLRSMLATQKGAETSDGQTTERALLATAVILYSRATSTSGQKGERGSIQLETSKLSDKERVDQKTLIEVRNQALAHAYSARPVASHAWHKELFFAVETQPGHWRAASATNQTGFHRETLERLERMLPVANSFVMEKFQKRMAAVTKYVNANGVGQQQIEKFAFDPVKAFGSEQGVQLVLDGASSLTTAFWVNE